MLNLTKQAKLISIDKLKLWNIEIYGAGSVGSNIIYQLAKTGFTKLKTIDFDTVEETNIPAQAFGNQEINCTKIEAIQSIIKRDIGITIEIENNKINTESVLYPPQDNTIIICSFDSLEARKILWDKIKKFQTIWIDARIGRFDQKYFIVNLYDRNEKIIKEYEESLNPKGPRSNLECGEKCSYPSNILLTAQIICQILNIIENRPYINLYVGNAIYPLNNCFRLNPERE